MQGMVPESHELVLPATPQLKAFFKSSEFHTEVRRKLKDQYEVDLHLRDSPTIGEESTPSEERILLLYTRNNAGGLKDAIDLWYRA